jgi:hypothetical protein
MYSVFDNMCLTKAYTFAATGAFFGIKADAYIKALGLRIMTPQTAQRATL